MENPVSSRDGQTYELEAIEEWFRNHSTSPLTGAHLDDKTLVPNFALRAAIEEWRKQQPMAIDASRLTLSSPEEVIGEGSWGRVVGGVLSFEQGHEQPVAVKQLPAMSNAEQKRQFDKELKAHMVALRADGVCRLFGSCEIAGRMCLVMKRYKCNLAERIGGKPMPPAQIRRIALTLCRTLEQLHVLGVVVQDIKPSNVLLDNYDMPVLADFGISDVVGRTTQVMPTSVKGTFNYMAPESFNPPLGVAPWSSMQMQQIMFAVAMQKRVPTVPEDVPAADTIRKCFLYEPRDRPTAAQLAAAISAESDRLDTAQQKGHGAFLGSDKRALQHC